MATTTKKFGLFKPELTDPADITQMNQNWDKIDEKLNNIPITSDVPSDAEMWIDPNEVSAEESHLINMNNPHNVTIEQIGAAPSGYGLGTTAKLLTSTDDLNTIKANGWYWWNFDNRPQNVPTDSQAYHMNIMRVWSQMDDPYGSCFQEIGDDTDSIYHGTKMQRTIYGSRAFEWEWVNPPMSNGIEYRTTERHDGKPVYALLCQFGALPNSTEKTKYGLCSNVDQPISISPHVVHSDGTKFAGLMSGLDSYGACQSEGNMFIAVETSENLSEYTAYFLVKYTKA